MNDRYAEPEQPKKRSPRTPLDLVFDSGSVIPNIVGEIGEVIERRGGCLLEQARSILGGLGLLPPRGPLVTPAPPPPVPGEHSPFGNTAPEDSLEEVPGELDGQSGNARTSETVVEGSALSALSSETGDASVNRRHQSSELPIPSYDSLSASQVVPRLASLENEELELIRAYETAGRNRRTILNRIEQLRSP